MNIKFLKNMISMNRNIESIQTSNKCPYSCFVVRSKTRGILFSYEQKGGSKSLYIDVMKKGKSVYYKTFLLNKYADTDITKDSFAELVNYLISRYKHINMFGEVMN